MQRIPGDEKVITRLRKYYLIGNLHVACVSQRNLQGEGEDYKERPDEDKQ